MDRGDITNALQVAGITQEIQDWCFEPDADPNKKAASVIVKRNVNK